LDCRNSVEDSHDEDQPHVQPRLLEHALEHLGLEESMNAKFGLELLTQKWCNARTS